MKAAIALVFFSLFAMSAFAADKNPPTIEKIWLDKMVYSAGEDLVVHFEGRDDASGIGEGCCSAVWVDPSLNVFRHSDGVNGRVTNLAGSHYKATNFPINTYVDTSVDTKFQISGFSIYDKAGNRGELRLAKKSDQFYTDQAGTLTNIPVVTFEIAKNQNADSTPATITKLALSKKIYQPGESLVLQMEASDGVSGISEGCCSAVWVDPSSNVFKHSDGVNGQVSRDQRGAFIIDHFPINSNVTGGSRHKIVGFSFNDKAGNRTELRLKNPTDTTYTDQTGKKTAIPVLSFGIAKNQNADNSAPQILSLSPDKNTYYAGDDLSITFTGIDTGSGISEGCCVAVWLDPAGNVFRHSDGVNGSISKLGGDTYRVTRLPINPELDSSQTKDYTLSGFSIYDKAGNRGELRLAKKSDQFYTDQDGKLTQVRVVKIRIE